MKTFIAVLLLMVTAPLAAGQVAHSANGSVKVGYNNGSSNTLNVAVSGIEDSGTFGGNISIGGRSFKLPKQNKKSGTDVTFYKWTWYDHNIKYSVTMLIGSPELEYLCKVSLVDSQTPGNTGSGENYVY